MRWILVLVFLYIIPLWLLFKNNKNFKRCSIYGSMYTVVASVIVISNIYMSTVNKIESIMEYRSYASDEKYTKENTIKEQKEQKNNKISRDINNQQKYVEEVEKEAHSIEFKGKQDNNDIAKTQTDIEVIQDFKDEIYEVERQALIPMRECMPDFKNMDISQEAIKQANDDVKYAKEKCDEVVTIYEGMSIPNLSEAEYMDVLEKAKLNVQKAYILRSKAMESSEKLLSTKNLKYIGEIKEYLRLSDKQIKYFVDSMKELQIKVNNEN